MKLYITGRSRGEIKLTAESDRDYRDVKDLLRRFIWTGGADEPCRFTARASPIKRCFTINSKSWFMGSRGVEDCLTLLRENGISVESPVSEWTPLISQISTRPSSLGGDEQVRMLYENAMRAHVDHNYEVAFKGLLEAAKQGYIPACYTLGTYYDPLLDNLQESGKELVKKDAAEAKKYYQLALGSGGPFSYFSRNELAQLEKLEEQKAGVGYATSPLKAYK